MEEALLRLLALKSLRAQVLMVQQEVPSEEEEELLDF